MTTRRHHLSLINDLANIPSLPWAARLWLLSKTGARFGSGSFVEPGSSLRAPRLIVGENTYINVGFFAEGAGDIHIGSNVSFGPKVSVVTSTHAISDDPKKRAGSEIITLPVTVGDGAWVGAGVLLLPGANVGEGCVIAAGAVVTNSTEPNHLYAGVPARKVRSLDCADARKV